MSKIVRVCSYHTTIGTSQYKGDREVLRGTPKHGVNGISFTSAFGGKDYDHFLPYRNLVFFNMSSMEVGDV